MNTLNLSPDVNKVIEDSRITFATDMDEMISMLNRLMIARLIEGERFDKLMRLVQANAVRIIYLDAHKQTVEVVMENLSYSYANRV